MPPKSMSQDAVKKLIEEMLESKLEEFKKTKDKEDGSETNEEGDEKRWGIIYKNRRGRYRGRIPNGRVGTNGPGRGSKFSSIRCYDYNQMGHPSTLR